MCLRLWHKEKLRLSRLPVITCATSLDHYGLQDLLQEMRDLVTILDGVKSKVLVLIEYNGQRKCRGVMCYNDAAARFREQLRTWAMTHDYLLTIEYEWV